MERRALEVFYFADTDKNGHLTREEYGALVLQDDFVTMDADRDGRVSVREFVAARTRDFDAADRDHDGVLSADEVKAPADGGAGR
jgi:Ca2+-binding EF-hand superfamily protein